MNKADILRKTGNILTELQEQFQYLRNHHEEITELELELFMANADFLKDHIIILQKLNQSAFHNQKAQTKQKIEEEKPVETIQKMSETPVRPQAENAPEEEPEKEKQLFEFEKHSNVEHFYDRPLSDEEKKVISARQENTVVEPSAPLNIPIQKTEAEKEPFLFTRSPEKFEQETPQPKATEFKEEASREVEFEKEEPKETIKIEESFLKPVETQTELPINKPVEQTSNYAKEQEATQKEEAPKQPLKPTINDLLSAQNKPSAMPESQVKDLKSAISLNQKLLFIKELFNGYNLAYSEAVELLNRFDSMEVADTFLKNNYAAKNNWPAKQAIVDQLYEILRRKYSK